MKRTKKKKGESKLTFTKKWLEILLVAAVVDMQLPFILAFLDKADIAETLAIAIVTEIVALFVPYLCKSYFETKEEKRNEMDKMMFLNEHEDFDERE